MTIEKIKIGDRELQSVRGCQITDLVYAAREVVRILYRGGRIAFNCGETDALNHLHMELERWKEWK